MKATVRPFKVRTVILMLAVVASALWRATKQRHEEALRHFPIIIYSLKDFEAPKRHLFEDLLPIATKLRRGEIVPFEEGYVGKIREDPRSLLYFLWDYLSKTEREQALQILGYPKNTDVLQLLKGPHPKWFSQCDCEWFGDHWPIHRCC